MAVRVGKDPWGQNSRTEDEQHQPEKASGENVLNSRDDGQSCDDECNTSDRCPELATERHPSRDHARDGLNSRQVRQAEVDGAKAE